jgi:hypothetical protein
VVPNLLTKLPEPPFPVSAIVNQFIDRLTSLTGDQWASIETSIASEGVEVSMLDASRNAAVALAVRDLITSDQFDQLYWPFALAIPLVSLSDRHLAD